MQVQQAAVDIVSGLSGSPEGIDRLKGVQVSLLAALLRIVGTPDAEPAVSRAALTALVNLSQDTALGKALLQLNTVGRVMEFVREKSCPHIDLLVRAGVVAVAVQGSDSSGNSSRCWWCSLIVVLQMRQLTTALVAACRCCLFVQLPDT
jgi:hypothetical protein